MAGAAAADFDAGDTIGSYRLEKRLAEGAMGVVFRATDRATGAVVAVKVMRDELAEDAEFLRRFEREGDIATTLDHPHLVRVLERGSAGGRHFLVSRFVPGPTLADRVRDGPLAPEEAARVAGHVAAGLDELHRLGLVHRDVKPANILFELDGRAVVTDFGVARGVAHSTLTRAGRVVGTVDYLAPELIRGLVATPLSDIYALGCVVYEMLAGKPPFARRAMAAACVAHLREPPPPLSPRSATAALDGAVRTALAKEPEARPRTATAYARLLRAALGA